LEAAPATRETVVHAGELFNITYRVKNSSPKIISTRITHKIEPRELQPYLDIVQCALLLPVKILPGQETEYSTTYAIRLDIPASAREVDITYEFKLEP
jgi:cytochrome c oxidase assembly protein Cox11